jgi:hypothetical protein
MLWQHCGTCDAGRSALGTVPLLFCQLRPSGLHLITRMAPDPPPAREGVRCRHEPLGEGPPTLAAGGPDLPLEGFGTSTQPSDLLSAHVNTLSRGVRDHHVPRYRWSTQDPDLQGPRNAITPHLEDCTPYSNDHAACWGWRDAGTIFARSRTMPRTTTTPDALPHSALPTVLDCCIPSARGETTTSAIPCTCTRPSLCL